MRCKVVIKFVCHADKIHEFLQRVKQLDRSVKCDFRNDMTFVNDDGSSNSSKGVKLLVNYNKLPELVELVFKNKKDVYIVSTKLLSGVSVKSNKSVKVVKKDVGFVATKWTDDEVKILQKMSANGASSAEISEKLNRSIKAIESKRRKLKQSKLWKELG